MGNLFLSLMELGGDLIKKSTHSLLSVEHVPCFLITLDVIFNFLLKILVYSFILENTQKALVDFRVEDFVFIGKF